VNKSGEVFTMGDDTMGQCGLGSRKRSTAPPFYTERIRNPEKVQNLPPIKKIVCGTNHTIVIGVDGV
jgi:alpha-tubulin suppressor-like RCC1 family protein